ncbi:ComF family protein [Streptomyces sp. NPDC051940]|uniref:ComF family protein n=1 Tax=Streptomyces sp. NPDC051940 TaxID=3155675 RepID=UPI00344782E2
MGAPAPVLLVPVPSAATSRAARGQDPTLRLARAAAASLRRDGVPARAVPLLRHRRPVADQAGLSAAERHANLSGALDTVPAARRLLSPAQGRSGGPWAPGTGTTGPDRQPARLSPATPRLTLIDDLITTGATLTEAARALRRVTTSPLYAAVIAAPRTAFEGRRKSTGNFRFRW